MVSVTVCWCGSDVVKSTDDMRDYLKRHTAIPAPFGLFRHADKSKVCIIRDTLQYLLRLDCSDVQTSQRYVS